MEIKNYESHKEEDRRPSPGISQYGVLNVRWFGLFRKTFIGDFDKLWEKAETKYRFGYTWTLERL